MRGNAMHHRTALTAAGILALAIASTATATSVKIVSVEDEALSHFAICAEHVATPETLIARATDHNWRELTGQERVTTRRGITPRFIRTWQVNDRPYGFLIEISTLHSSDPLPRADGTRSNPEEFATCTVYFGGGDPQEIERRLAARVLVDGPLGEPGLRQPDVSPGWTNLFWAQGEKSTEHTVNFAFMTKPGPDGIARRQIEINAMLR
jgi:hypothetical protein